MVHMDSNWVRNQPHPAMWMGTVRILCLHFLGKGRGLWCTRNGHLLFDWNMELLFLSCTPIFWLCPSGDFVPRYRCWPTWQHCSSSSELRNFFRICLSGDVSISYFPQQHGLFQRTDFKDNSCFFISGVFSSVLILDTFFFASHLFILYLGTSFICVCLLYSSFYL